MKGAVDSGMGNADFMLRGPTLQVKLANYHRSFKFVEGYAEFAARY